MHTTVALCADCQINNGAHEIRRRRLCSDCFIRYVQSKVFKRMDTFRFKNLTGNDASNRRRLLLPLSGGVSSLALLNALDTQLKGQREKQNRTAYDLILVHVDVDSVDGDDDDDAGGKGERNQRGSTLLSSLPSSSSSSSHTLLPDVPIHTAFQHDSRLEQDLAALGLAGRAQGQTDRELYVSVMAAASTPTARSDLEHVFLKRVVVSLAKKHACEGVLWGHSDSRLAALALADVAKGRGGAVPSTLADGPSLAGVRFHYPMRDLYKTELELYARVLPEPLDGVVAPEVGGGGGGGGSGSGPVLAIRNTSIDSLLSTYITSQGEKYPSIMANVVRTASKLQPTELNGNSPLCVVCLSEVDGGAHSNSGSGNHEEKNGNTPELLCYGCRRMKQDIKITG